MLYSMMQRVMELKKEFLAGRVTKQQVADAITTMLRQLGAILPEMSVTVDEMPASFWLPCDCPYCRAERGEGPLPLHGVVEIQSIYAAYQFGIMSKTEAMMRLEQALRKYNVTAEQVAEFWNSRSPANHGVTPMGDDEKAFFDSLEAQMKDVPPEEK